MEINVFEYDDLVELLVSFLEHKKKKNANFSLRSWSKSLGYKHPSFLSQCLRGDRSINFIMLSKIIERESVSENESAYIKYLYLKHLARGELTMDVTMLNNVVKTKLMQNN